MSFEDFELFFDKLCKYYDANKSAEVKEVYYKELRYFPKEKISQLEHAIYRDNKFFPKLPDIIEAVKSINKKEYKPVESCLSCVDGFRTGRISNEKGTFEYAFACDCDAGKQKETYTARYKDMFVFS